MVGIYSHSIGNLKVLFVPLFLPAMKRRREEKSVSWLDLRDWATRAGWVGGWYRRLEGGGVVVVTV